MKQTAVDFIDEAFTKYLEYYVEGKPNVEVFTISDLGKAIIAAKKIEKEQMINFHAEVMKAGLIKEGEIKWNEDYFPIIKKTAETYYKETYEE